MKATIYKKRLERTPYDITLSIEDIDKAEKENLANKYYNPNYFKILKSWYRVLGITEGNTQKISDPDLIDAKLKEKEVPGTALFYMDGGVSINYSITIVCGLLEYQTFSLGYKNGYEKGLEGGKAAVIHSANTNIEQIYDKIRLLEEKWVDGENYIKKDAVMNILKGFNPE